MYVNERHLTESLIEISEREDDAPKNPHFALISGFDIPHRQIIQFDSQCFNPLRWLLCTLIKTQNGFNPAAY